MACADGNYKMVEVLLEHGADKDVKDRWGSTPLWEAIHNRQTLVASLLSNLKATLGTENPASILCEYAGNGELEQVRRLVENKVNPDKGDYDGRTALHISSSEGHDKVVEFLLTSKANPNVEDRWGGTPLQVSETLKHRVPSYALTRRMMLRMQLWEATSPSPSYSRPRVA